MNPYSSVEIYMLEVISKLRNLGLSNDEIATRLVFSGAAIAGAIGTPVTQLLALVNTTHTRAVYEAARHETES